MQRSILISILSGVFAVFATHAQAQTQSAPDAEYAAAQAKLRMAIHDAAGSTRSAIVLPVSALENPVVAGSFQPVARDPETRIAIEGYDPVGYFTDNKAMLGDPAFRAEHDGAVYFFATAEHREMFLATPKKFLPAYGGYCTETIAMGSLTPASPLHWTVHGDRLYLTRSAAANKEFREHRARSLDAANEYWAAADAFRDKANIAAVRKEG